MQDLLSNIGQVFNIYSPWDVFIYVIFFLSLITLMLIPDKNMQPTLLMSVVLLFCIIDKVRPAAGRPWSTGEFIMPGFDDLGFGTLLIHIGMAIFPIVAGTLIRARSEKQKRGTPMGILTGMIAGVYAIAFFFSTGGIGATPF
ncbi:MAG: hypothetical protein D6712_00275 [Chloroflexi bacterium]|nr:MAG: hypothetical protein D6712_00275 [Chloroflexota bacterium]